MFANAERILLYKELREVYKNLSSKKKQYNSSNNEDEKKILDDEITKLIGDEQKTLSAFHKVKEDENDYIMCDHIFFLGEENKLYCPNCGRYFVEDRTGVYDEIRLNKEGKDKLVNWAGIPKLSINEDDEYEKMLYLRAFTEFKDQNAVNLHVLEDAILRIYKEDCEYQKEIDDYKDEKCYVSLVNYIKKYGLY